MKAFFIANVDIKDTEKFQEYAQAAEKSMQPFGGQLVIRGKSDKNLAGDLTYKNVSVVSFPDSASLDAWFASDAYQTLIPLREEAADMLLTSFHVPD